MEYLSIIISAAVAITTLSLAIATWKMAAATQETLKAQFRPWVIVYAELDRDHPECINLVIENIGTAPATNISFHLPEYFPWDATGIRTEESKKAKNLDRGPLRNGMKFLAPGACWRSYWGQYGGLVNSLENQDVEIKVSFSHEGGHSASSTTNVLDVRDFASIGWTHGFSKKQTDALEKQASALTGIKDSLRKMVGSNNS